MRNERSRLVRLVLLFFNATITLMKTAQDCIKDLEGRFYSPYEAHQVSIFINKINQKNNTMTKTEKPRSTLRAEAAKEFWRARSTKEPAYEHMLYWGEFLALKYAEDLLRIYI